MDKIKVVFHIDTENISTFELMLTNIINLMKDIGNENLEIIVIANGTAVKSFVKESNMKYSTQLEELHKKLEELHKKNVKFYICNNSLNVNKINKDHLFEFCEIVPAGITKLIELQRNNYIYIKP